MPTRPPNLVARFHADDRGNLGILLLLVLWALVALIGLVWNTGEYATRRRAVQTAADSAAHTANLWTGRTTNLTAATNMVMAQNGSAEVILRSVTPTAEAIQKRFDAERKRATQLKDGNTPGQSEQNIPDCEYFEELLGFGGFSGNGRGDKRQKDLQGLTPDVLQALKRILPLLSPQQAARLQQEVPENLRRNVVGLGWINGTWVGGGNPANKDQPGPSVTGGLRGSVGDWVTGQVRPRLDDILRTLDAEQSTLDQWTAQTDPATSGTTPEVLRQKRADIFDYQKQIRDLTPQAVDEQRQKLADFYKVDLTFSAPGRPSDDSGPAPVQAPIGEASVPESKSQADSIRQRYPQATEAKFGSADPTVTVDPINVNVRNAVIWHPGDTEQAPPGVTLYRQSFQGSFHVGGGEWGKVPCAPLSRYFNDRVSRDMQGLRTEPQQIDQARADLRSRVHPPPAPPTVTAMPGSIADVVPQKTAVPVPPEQIPRLPTPESLSDAEKAALEALNERIRQYNSDLRKYVNELNGLNTPLQRMYSNLSGLTDSSGQRFADQTWLNNVEQNRQLVLLEMGDDKQFMVLKTYALRFIPDWAKEGMRADVQQYVYRVVYDRNIGRVTNQARQRLEQWATGVILGQLQQQQQQQGGGGRGGAGQLAGVARQQARQFANANAPGVAQYVVSRAAQQISREVAAEWIQRPWPFEIDTPKDPVPPTAGLTDKDRKENFTFLAGAKTNDDSGPRPFFSKIFNQNQDKDTGKERPLTAFAQGETFNWMEYNGRYGAGDAFDRITDFGHGDMGGSPRPWRVSTIGGWTWQPRLALSDALGQAMEDGPDFRSFLEQGGVGSYDPDAIKTLTLH